MLFSDQRHHKLVIPAHDKDTKPVTIAYLIDYLCQHVMKDSRKELFVLDDHMYVLLLHRPFPVPRSFIGHVTRWLPCQHVCLISFPSCSRHCTHKAFLMHLRSPSNRQIKEGPKD